MQIIFSLKKSEKEKLKYNNLLYMDLSITSGKGAALILGYFLSKSSKTF